ncbi:sterol O-acyltransferase 1-like [Teleopsis dalmanni]|uniref:sterol O-acyltransferase 1-like n=1 Tax=Teleopsis dalmanni TaxID=139649 RepID=UPI0018CD76C3|nr:sterol O-acyltransferase 1-like [Teleopsis dalmanni]
MITSSADSEDVHNLRNSSTQNDSSGDNIDKELNFLRHKLEKFQHRILKDVMEDVIREIHLYEFTKNEFRNLNLQYQNRLYTSYNRVRVTSQESNSNTINIVKQKQRLPEKVFVSRESYLTALLEVDHIKTILYIFYAILLVLFLNTLCYSYFAEEKIKIGLDAFKSGFEKIEYVFLIWCFQHVFVFLLYFAFKLWASVRSKLHELPFLLYFWSIGCLIIYISSQLLFGYEASIYCLKLNLPFVCGGVLLLETTRLLMKMHSFVRLNARRIITGNLKLDSGDNNLDNPLNSLSVLKFSNYVYFLFAPTLLYRDSYPRTRHIRWKFALTRFMEVVAVAFMYSYLHERYIRVYFANMCLEELHGPQIVDKLFGMLMPGAIIFLCGFYLIQHSWLNFTSEILRFGDRLFYKNWWSLSAVDVFFRSWNIPIHDWLYEFIYKDLYEYVFRRSKAIAASFTFFVSAAVHEYILSLAFHSFFPVIFFFFFVFSVPMFLIAGKVKIGNFLFWSLQILTNGTIITLYSMEYYARQNYPRSLENWSDYLLPTIWVCYNK